MKRFKLGNAAAFTMAAVIAFHGTVLAVSFSDVPSNHWAYGAITRMADKGLMSGDSTGKYEPNSTVDKFYAAKVLAKAAGYKYVGLTNEEELYIQRAYNANKAILGQFRNAFEKWDSTADKEVAYLLEKGILVVTDLNQFVVRLAEGGEKLRSLNREEYCTFLVRLMGKEEEAAKNTGTAKFADDASISDENKNSVYYLKKLGVVAGDTNNRFNPNAAVTKAAMAVMTDKVVAIMNPDQGSASANQPTTTTPPATSSVVSSVSGSLYKIYPSLNAVQIKNSSGTVATYKFSTMASIYVDGYLRTINDLAEGMTVTGVITNLDLTELRAQTASKTTVNTETTNKQLTQVEGTVSAVENTNVLRSIKMKVRTINARGVVSVAENTYSLAEGCTITRNGVASDLATVKPGEVVYAGVSGNSVYTLALEEKDIKLNNVTLVEKRYDADMNKTVLTVAEANGKEHQFVVGKDSVITRDGYGKCKWSRLRIGDTISLSAEYGEILKLDAVGVVSAETGWVSEIFQSNDVSRIRLRETEAEDSPSKEYIISTEDVTLPDLTINSKVKLLLDSDEVTGINVLVEAVSKPGKYFGYVFQARADYINVVDELGNEDYEKIYFDRDTKVVDAVAGETVKANSIYNDMEVYITIRIENGKKYAKTITIIDYND